MNLPTWTEAATEAPRKVTEMNYSRKSDQYDGRERYGSQHQQLNSENARPMQTNRQFAESSADLDNSRSSYNRMNMSDINGNGRFNIRSDRDIQDTFDAFKYREVCLNSSSKTKMVANFLNKIKDHINKEACLEAETAANFGAVLDDPENNPFRSQYSFAASIAVPREVQMLDNCSSELRAAAHACIKAVVECFESRKNIYLTQLKKIRETSNMATRNAVQHERSEASIFIGKLRDSLEAQRRQEVSDAQSRVTELEALVAQLRATAEITTSEVNRLTQLEQNRLSLQQAAVAEAVQHLKEESRREKEHQQEISLAERQRLQAEAQSIVDDMKLQAESRIATQKEHDQELRELLVQDKARVEAEVVKLREELINTVSKLTSEKERSVARLAEERERAERDQHAALAEAVKGQAVLRAEMAAMVQRVKSEELKRHAEQDIALTKFREQLLVQHSLEIEKINDRHRNEIKKYHAELQVRNQDAISKLKHVHEQELNRLIRDNDRLQRIIVRHGGAELFRTVAGTHSGNGSDPLSTSREDLSFDTSYHHHSSHASATSANVPHSPGMQFASRGAGSGSASKQPLSKSPIYSSRIRESLTPPGKFYKDRTDSPPRRVPETSGGGSGSGAKSHQQELQDKLASVKRSVGFDSAKLSSKYASSNHNDDVRGSSSSGDGGAKGQRVPDSPPPPAPKSVKSVLNWGALEESLNQQESNDKPKFSASHLPPDGFPLDESVFAVKSARNGKMGIGIEENTLRVGKYMNDLDNYLLRNGGHAGSTQHDQSLDQLSVLHQLPSAAHTLDTSSTSSLNFRAQAETKYMEARERHGLNPKSRTYDSDSDGHSEDSLYGEEIGGVNTTGTSRGSSDFISP